VRDSVDVAVIGAGQAGLATSYCLTQAGVDHVVLEAGRVGETWRTRRWDSFCLVTPNGSVHVPGARYSGPEPDGYMPLKDIISFLDSWSASFKAPVLEHTPVSQLGAGDAGFMLSLPEGRLSARRVVVASGAYQRAHRPLGADALPKSVVQILAEEYRNPAALPPGKVLIVGSGQTGCQLAEELFEDGRKVFLSCGRCPWSPRRINDRDLVWWLANTGFAERGPDQLPSPAARLIGNPQATGHGGGHDLHFRTLHQLGVELLGHFRGADDGRILFADDLAKSVDASDFLYGFMKKYFENYCVSQSMPLPELETPEPMRVKSRNELDIRKEGIGTVIWTSGYRPDYGWVKLPLFDDMGFPIQTDGRSEVPGLYFVGVHWMRKQKSAILMGVGEDAEVVTRQLVESRR
jgi:putative flavoprotein involved in K+ transport